MRMAVLFFSQKYLKICKLLSLQYDVLFVEEVPELWEKYSKRYNFQCISVEELLSLYKDKQIEKIIIMPAMRKTLNHFITKLMDNGILEEDILYLPIGQNNKVYKNASQILADMCLFREREDLDYLGIHVYDGCNFKCRHCSMLEGAALSYKEISLEKTEKSVFKLSKIFRQIGMIQIMGGEPLLNDQLFAYLSMIRKYYPYSEMQVLTNGSLILKQTDELFDVMRDKNISFTISRYPELDASIEDINYFLKEKRVPYYFTDRIDTFLKYYDFMQEADIDSNFDICQSMQYCKNGLNVRENLVAPCCVPFAIEHMFGRFGMDYSFCTVLNLEDDIRLRDITDMLSTSHQMCKVCHLDGFSEWKQVESNEKSDIKNWSV